MKILDLTFDSPQLDLSCDEALLDESEAGDGDEVLRFWSPSEHYVVLGYSNAWKDEIVDRKAQPVFRRCSGGGTVLQGPGCLNYSLVLKIVPGGPLDGIRSTNEFVMETNRKALDPLAAGGVRLRGLTDLVLGDRKFSGNSQRRKKTWLLFHGTFLLDFDLPRIGRALKMPPKQPCYREGRAHDDFVTNLGAKEARVKEVLAKIWKAEERLGRVPKERIDSLARERYSKDDWNFKF